MSFIKDQARLARLSMEDLVERQRKIQEDPANRNPPGSFRIYKKSAERRLDAITWAITYKLAEEKERR